MKNYLDKFYPIKEFILDNPEYEKHAINALHYCMGQHANLNENDYTVIQVEGYYCIAYVLDDFAPYELDKLIVPFDKEKVYPLQGLVTEYAFKRYN